MRLALGFGLAALCLIPGCKTLKGVVEDIETLSGTADDGEKAEQTAKTESASTEQAQAKLSAPAPAQAAPAPPAAPATTAVAMPTMPSMPAMPKVGGGDGPRARMAARRAKRTQSKSQSSSEIRCCVNGAFYECDSAASAKQCIGEPMALMQCVQGCGFKSNCEPKCIDAHGPDPSACRRKPGRDGQCRKRR